MDLNSAKQLLSDELSRLWYASHHVARDQHGVGPVRSLSNLSWEAMIDRFFDTVHNITWRQSPQNTLKTLRSGITHIIITPTFVCTTKVIDRVPNFHPTTHELLLSEIDLSFDRQPGSDGYKLEGCTLLEITDIFFEYTNTGDFFDRSEFTFPGYTKQYIVVNNDGFLILFKRFGWYQYPDYHFIFELDSAE